MNLKLWYQQSSEPNKRFHLYFVMWVMAWIMGFILTMCLFLRGTPYDGTPYVIDLWHYFPHAIFYMTYGISVIVAPFMLASLLIKDDEKHKRCQRVFRIICAILLTLSLLYEHIDNEILRYCNMHITHDFLTTYVLSQGVPDALWSLLEEDAGGSNLSLYLLSIPVIFLISWFAFGWRIPNHRNIRKPAQWVLFGIIGFTFVFLPALLRTDLFLSKNRQAKVAPPVVLIIDAIKSSNRDNSFPSDMPERLSAIREEWQKYNHDSWVQNDDKKPWSKEYTGNCPSNDKQYNFLIIAFESYRARSLSLFNPHETIEATPYFNSIVKNEKSAYYTQYYTNGHPTIAAFMALHTGLLPHSSHTVAQTYNGKNLDSFINIMKNHGYQTMFFAASDPDWDFQRSWLMRWYNSFLYNPKHTDDRPVMQDVSQWLLTRQQDKPFVATVFLISNHMPFHIPEPDKKINDSSELKEKIYNTMHYDDDVLREFMDSIKNEPWFENTIIVLTGDHGLDLGDRGDSPDYNNLRDEAIHVPLVLYGNHPRLPHGEQKTLSSHIDLGPTILDLAGICEKNNGMGYSLLSLQNEPERAEYAFKANRAAIHTGEWSAYIDEYGKVMLFDKNDDLQLNDISEAHPDVAEKLKKRAKDMSIAVDYCYQNDLY